MSSQKRVQAIIDAIGRDNTSGAAELTAKAARALRAVARATAEVTEFVELFHRTVFRLIEAQSSMAPILNLVNRVSLRIEGLDRMAEIKTVMERELKHIVAAQRKSSRQLAENFYALIKGGGPVATYSYSSTVVTVLRYAKRRGKVFQVLCSESRPVCEGVATAKRLARAGIKTTLVTEAALSDLIKEANLLVTGADAVTAHGVVNKVGTYALAVVAKENKVPFYCLCAEDKFLAPGLSRLFRIVEKDAKEVARLKHKNLVIRNYYFDCTPFKYITGVVTERQVLKGSAVRSVLKSLVVTPILSRGHLLETNRIGNESTSPMLRRLQSQ
jgi:translation initiation factor 2B subunit (eIF-2B alpha/beta/delta family)